MANIYTKILRKVNRDEFDFLAHALEELDDENFSLAEVEKVILKPFRFFEFTDDESHVRYAFDGEAENGRMLRVIVFLRQGRVKIKTGYEIFD
ncbi:MAG: DUF4258 domain-containing protein [Acidobacteriota bacterium]|nr:DUF4258 domain-containing protein [Acidobacteriota bacterium]